MPPPEHRGIGRGLDLAIEFLAAIFTWGGIGWVADRFLGTAPALMVIGFMVGNACGIYLLWLRSQREEDARRAAKNVPPATGNESREGNDGAAG